MNAQAWRLRAVYALRRLGLPGALGALCMLALLAFVLLEVRPSTAAALAFYRATGALATSTDSDGPEPALVLAQPAADGGPGPLAAALRRLEPLRPDPARPLPHPLPSPWRQSAL